MAKAVSFDSISINSGNYVVRKVLHEEMTPRDLFMYQLSREGGAELVNTEWKPKRIVIEGIIKGTSVENLESNIDAFKYLLSGVEKNLDIEYDTGTRRYVATANVIQIERDYYHLSYAPFSVELTVASGEGKAVSSISHGTTSITAKTLETDSFTITGTKLPKYQISITFGSATNVSEVSVSLNGDTITVAETISAGQVLVIDTENKKCTIDGTEKAYTGFFPRVLIGTNTYKIVSLSTSHQYNVDITYTPTYL